MLLKLSRVLWKCLGWIWKSLGLLLFLSTFALLIASHTISSLAFLTSATISAATGLTSIISDERGKYDQTRTELEDRNQVNRQLVLDLDQEKRQTVSLRTQLNETELDQDIIHRLSRTVVDERSRADTLALELEMTRADKNLLSNDLRRLEQAQTLQFRGRETTVREAVEETISAANTRILKTASTNVASMPAEGIPFYGIAIIAAATAFEADMACRTMDDFYELQIALEPGLTIPVERDEVCGLAIPTKEEVWDVIRKSPTAAWDKSVAGLDAVSTKIWNLDRPDFGLIWQRVIQQFDHWF